MNDHTTSYPPPPPTKPIHRFWWLIVPLIFMAIQIVLESTLNIRTLGRMHSEGGPHESLQFVVLVLALFTALQGLYYTPRRKYPAFAGWLALAALCCLYVAGEEVSWGQHIFSWSTPEFWQAVNDQQETNLHNTSSWLDQKPRLLLEIGVISAGLIIPLLMKYAPAKVPAKFALIYAPVNLSLIALLVLGLRLVDVIEDASGIVLLQRSSEVIELYLFYFVLLYLIVMKRRAKALKGHN